MGHVLWLFFNWPNGAIWGNVWAMPVCGVLAGVAAYLLRDRLGRALKGWWARHFGHHDALAQIHARLDAHADLLDHETPGGLGAVMAELGAVRSEVANLAEAVREVLAARSLTPEADPETARTPVKPAVKAAKGMGSRVPKEKM